MLHANGTRQSAIHSSESILGKSNTENNLKKRANTVLYALVHSRQQRESARPRRNVRDKVVAQTVGTTLQKTRLTRLDIVVRLLELLCVNSTRESLTTDL